MGPRPGGRAEILLAHPLDMEKSFNIYNHTFSNRRHKFKEEENLEKIVVTNYCYAGK